ncbi:MAG: bifunctional oligoribonuclease/PAP phosphatase NrnA [Bulleidia sp.]
MTFTHFYNTIQQADIITVFRHTNPDCDAVGSQFGLVQWIKDNWPDKQVYACGFDQPNQGVWPVSDDVPDAVIENSLAIVLDTANRERVDDDRFVRAKTVYKVDHHPVRDNFGDYNIVDENSAATCQLLAKFLEETQPSTITKQAAEYLYAGILTDTLNFTTSNTTADTLKSAGFLCQYGVDIPVLARSLFDKSLNGFRFSAWVRSNVQTIDGTLAYEIIPASVQHNFNMTPSKARSFIDELGHVRDFQVWVVFTEKTVDGKTLYDGSIRSKTVTVNDIAEQYNGGGHKNASGIKNLTEDMVHSALKALQERIREST